MFALQAKLVQLQLNAQADPSELLCARCARPWTESELPSALPPLAAADATHCPEPDSAAHRAAASNLSPESQPVHIAATATAEPPAVHSEANAVADSSSDVEADEPSVTTNHDLSVPPAELLSPASAHESGAAAYQASHERGSDGALAAAGAAAAACENAAEEEVVAASHTADAGEPASRVAAVGDWSHVDPQSGTPLRRA